MKPIVIRLKLSGGSDSIIPTGLIETLTIEIVDGLATFHFHNAHITKSLCKKHKQEGLNSKYIERVQKTICQYPNMKADAIKEHIKGEIIKLSAKEVKK